MHRAKTCLVVDSLTGRRSEIRTVVSSLQDQKPPMTLLDAVDIMCLAAVELSTHLPTNSGMVLSLALPCCLSDSWRMRSATSPRGLSLAYTGSFTGHATLGHDSELQLIGGTPAASRLARLDLTSRNMPQPVSIFMVTQGLTYAPTHPEASKL
jgi:hypothetical protein